MNEPKLFTYTHKFDKYDTFYCVAPNRYTANALLTLFTADIPGYDGFNCDFDCKETSIPIVLDDFMAARFIEMAIELLDNRQIR